jgi:hypothetical protein
VAESKCGGLVVHSWRVYALEILSVGPPSVTIRRQYRHKSFAHTPHDAFDAAELPIGAANSK